MILLLDTHALAWAIGQPSNLSLAAREAIESAENSILVSSVSIWEMSIKFHLGKWPEVAPFLDSPLYHSFLQALRASELPIQSEHARCAGAFPQTHRDPFDRLLAAQALCEGVTLVSKDTAFDPFPISRLW